MSAAVACALVLLTWGTVVTLYSGLLNPYERAKKAIERRIGWERFHELGMEMFNRYQESTLVPEVERPEEIRELGINMSILVNRKEDSGTSPFVVFILGGGFDHYGFLVSFPGPRPDIAFPAELLADGVWGYSERGIGNAPATERGGKVGGR